ncbi:MAG: cellulase family glycosylhydrolase [Armatimonadota bacterium]
MGYLRTLLIMSFLPAIISIPAASATLGITDDGRFFKVDKTPVFLCGISYYGAMSISTPSFVTKDLADMKRDGINWIRVWAYWNAGGFDVSVTDREGKIREPYMSRLKRLIRECNRRNMIVDVTITRGDAPFPGSQEQHLKCAKTLARELLPYRNVYIDIGNERDIRDARYVSYDDMGALISAIKEIDPKRLCTASGVPSSRDDLRKYIDTGHCDFICPHLGREEGSALKTAGRVSEMIGWMQELNVRVPIHLQEPFRRGYTSYEPVESDFLTDAKGAKNAEAAGWCFHNGSMRSKTERPYRSFLMNDQEGRLYDQLDEVERNMLSKLKEAIGGTHIDTKSR